MNTAETSCLIFKLYITRIDQLFVPHSLENIEHRHTVLDIIYQEDK